MSGKRQRARPKSATHLQRPKSAVSEQEGNTEEPEKWNEGEPRVTMHPTRFSVSPSMSPSWKPRVKAYLETSWHSLQGLESKKIAKATKAGSSALQAKPPTLLIPHKELPPNLPSTEEEEEIARDPLGAVRRKREIKEEGATVMKVVLEPWNPRNTVSFKRNFLEPSKTPVRLVAFEHVKGSKVYDGLFPTFLLPNGKEAHFYDPGSHTVDEMVMEPPPPHERPFTLHDALQQHLPSPGDLLARSFGPALSFLPDLFVHKPLLCHMALGRQQVDCSEKNWTLQAKVKVELRRKLMPVLINTDSAVAGVAMKWKTWNLNTSIFTIRLDADHKDLLDTPKTFEAAVDMDWGKLPRGQLVLLLERAELSTQRVQGPAMKKQSHAALFAPIKEYIAKNYELIARVFDYYCVLARDTNVMTLDSFTGFLEDSHLPDVMSRACRKLDLQEIFRQSKASKDAPGITRSSFMLVLMKIAQAKFGGKMIDSLQLALDQHLLHNLPPEAQATKNEFREQRMYNQEISRLLSEHLHLLRAIFDQVKEGHGQEMLRRSNFSTAIEPDLSSSPRMPKSAKKGSKKKIERASVIQRESMLLPIEAFADYILSLGLDALVGKDKEITGLDLRVMAMWSILALPNETDPRGYNLAFGDFFEALCRVADVLSLPALSTLPVECSNLLMFLENKSYSELLLMRRPSFGINKERVRPLSEKLESLMDVMFTKVSPLYSGMSYLDQNTVTMIVEKMQGIT